MRKIEHDLFTGKITVSELSDANCRETLRRIIKRHSNALGQLEQKLSMDEASIPAIEIVEKSDGTDLVSKDQT